MPTDIEIEFEDAVSQNDLAHARWLLGRPDIDVNKPHVYRAADGAATHHYALTVAVEHNFVEMAKLLIKEGAKIDELSITTGEDDSFIQQTPLGIATFQGFVEMVRLLLSSGADVNKKDSIQETPLDTACDCGPLNGHGEIVNMLCRAGADMDVEILSEYTDPVLHTTITRLMTPLDTACMNGKPEVVRALLRHNAPFALGLPRSGDDVKTTDPEISVIVMEHVVSREKCVVFAMCQVDRLKNFDPRKTQIPELDRLVIAMILEMTFWSEVACNFVICLNK